MSVKKQHLRSCLFRILIEKKLAEEVKEMICSALGKGAVSYSTKRFQRFKSGNLNFEDKERPEQ